MVKKEKPKVIITVGKRKNAIARAKITPGTGRILINSRPLEVWGNEFLRMRIMEPLILAGDLVKKVNIEVSVRSGGTTGQTEAVRMAIARGLLDFSGSKELKNKFLQYDRNLLVFDFRRNEPHHAGGASKRGSRRHKQRSKR
ncbi:MAG: 30S ribosomal protein S9 [Candidatus Aenigmarchaeota archaeon]|nr:30S ribosomal protein S9 [Candidatus Aenigmarchaeota archaeon]